MRPSNTHAHTADDATLNTASDVAGAVLRYAVMSSWQRALRKGDCFVARCQGRRRVLMVWVVVLDSPEGSPYVHARRFTRGHPCGVDELVPRAAGVFPVSRDGFLAAECAGWPSALPAVHALVSFVEGGSA